MDCCGRTRRRGARSSRPPAFARYPIIRAHQPGAVDMPDRTLAIVGASLAGAKAAEAARDAGYDGRVVLIGDEAAAPYERPPLSKAVLRGEAEPASARV